MITRNIYKILFLLSLPLLYTMFIGRYGLEDSDSGFLLGMGWRIFNGELPYKDFLYVRPPLSPYLSALYLLLTPSFGQVFYLRLINNFQLLIQVTLTVLIIRKFYDFKFLKIDTFAFIVLCYFITLTGTLYFQWHTTDGILFAVIGFFLLVYFENKNHIYFVSGLFFCASMLTKQNFITVPLICAFYVYLEKGIRKSIFVSLGTITGLFIFYLFLTYNDVLENFLILTTGATNLSDLFIAGFAYYFVKHDYLILYISIVSVLSILYYSFYKWRSNVFKKLKIQPFILLTSIIILFFFSIVNVFVFESNERIISFDRILPVIVCIVSLYLFLFRKETIKSHYSLFVLIGISWSSSISWGGMTPIMYFTPIVFATYYILVFYTETLQNKYVNYSIYSLIIITSIIHKIVPYRNGFLWKNTNDGIALSDKLAFIKVDNDFFDKHLEYKAVLNVYRNVTILPSMPGADFLYEKSNPFIVDWAMDVESNFNRSVLFNNIDTCCDFILVEKKNIGQPIGVSGKFYSSVTSHVINNFELVDDSFIFFDVYQKNNK